MQITITEKPTPLAIPQGCSLLELENTGAESIFRGWEPTTTGTAGAKQGLTLAAGEQIIYGGQGVPLSMRTLYLACNTGLTSTLNYTCA